jgi:hypothetical protein
MNIVPSVEINVPPEGDVDGEEKLAHEEMIN